jgi:hypothetical protein
VVDASRQAIEPDDYDGVDSPAAGRRQQLVERRAPLLGARNPVVDVLESRPARAAA